MSAAYIGVKGDQRARGGGLSEADGALHGDSSALCRRDRNRVCTTQPVH